jgi:hypothetical protein
VAVMNSPLGVRSKGDYSQAGKPRASSVIGARLAEMFGKGGVHEVGTVDFTVIAWGAACQCFTL